MVSLGIFSVAPPTEPCALRSTQPLKVSTRDFSWGKGGRCVGLTTYHPCTAETSRKSGALTYPEPLGPPRPVAGHFYFTLLCSSSGGQNCIITASGIVTFCKRPYSTPVQSGLQSALCNRHTVRPFTESDDTRGCNNTICPPEDEHSTARNMLRIIM